MDNITLADCLTFIGQMEAGFNKAMEEGRMEDAAEYSATLGLEWGKVEAILRKG